ncbi:hypothetical protein Cgig2_005770 [Carnegiea gigantea]|uniref:Uncharacterized protein n=1 Tax=Carnegiea gigantea TaxID=171969 RepID=A0A9Q1JNG5_9CARY|nr:hypothetical protein Cgig2_005770 [Carnegiea gigantea]
MASGLKEVWQRLNLTEEEDEVIDVDDVDFEERSEQIELCLYGKLLTEKSFNARITKTLKEVTRLEKPSKVSLTTTRFWVKAYDLPAKKQTIACAQMLGNKLGSFVDCDEMMMMGADKSLCFRVDIDINKAPIQGVRILVAKQPMWTKIGCTLYNPQTDEIELQYGDWIRSSLLKSRGRAAVSDLKEEKRLYQAFCNNKARAKVRNILVFNDKDRGLGSHAKSNVDSTVDSSSKMIIDDTPLINAAIDFCKRKAGDISVDSRSVDKVREMGNPLGDQLHASSSSEGLGESQAIADLRILLWRLLPKVVFLSETKCSKSKMEDTVHWLGDFVGAFVDARGRSGGLALLLEPNVNVQLLSSSFNHIDTTIRLEG